MAETRAKTKLETARDRFKRCAEHEDKQRKIILACKEFRALNQWPDEVKIQRQGGPSIQGQAAQPPRPMLTIDRISQPTRQVSNSVKAANFAMNVQPNGHGADQDTADIIKGILRQIQNRARAEAPVDWAADGAAEGGIGWFRVKSTYALDDAPKSGMGGPEYGDQDLELCRVTNNLSVYCDPSSVKPTRSDADFMFVTEDVPKDEAKRRWDTINIDSLDEFRATGDDKGWVTEDTVRVAEYWTRTYVEATLTELLTPQGAVWVTDLPADTPKDAIGKQRKLFQPKVTCCIITATQELDEWEWPGRRIPLFPILGEELNVDGQQILRGVIAPAMDAQRMVNYMYSGAIETVALAPKAPLIVAEGQVERYKDLWQNANRFNYSYLPYTPVSLLGAPVPPPQRDQAEAPIQAMVVMLDRSEEAIKATTGLYDPSLGRGNASDSGRKVMALQKQAEQGTSNYIDNVITALTECGDELVYLMPFYYDRPGRIVQILGIDDQPEQVMLNQPYQQTPQGPQPHPEVTAEMAKLQRGLAKFYDVKSGRYAVTVVVGKSFTTKREEGAQQMGEMLSANPQLLTIFGDLFFRDLDIPGSQEIAERMKAMLDPRVQKQEGPDDPQQMKAQLQQQNVTIQQLQEGIQQAQQIISTDQVKADADLQREQMKQFAETERTKIERESDERMARLKLVADLLKTRATLEVKQTEAMIDAETAQLDREVALAGQREAREDAAQQKDIDRKTSMTEAERARQHELTLASQAQKSENTGPA